MPKTLPKITLSPKKARVQKDPHYYLWLHGERIPLGNDPAWLARNIVAVAIAANHADSSGKPTATVRLGQDAKDPVTTDVAAIAQYLTENPTAGLSVLFSTGGKSGGSLDVSHSQAPATWPDTPQNRIIGQLKQLAESREREASAILSTGPLPKGITPYLYNLEQLRKINSAIEPLPS
jgi:hypothetical protein